LSADSGSGTEVVVSSAGPGAAHVPVVSSAVIYGGSQGANAGLLGNYIATSFVTTAGGWGGTSSIDATYVPGLQAALTTPHTG
jgi:hypothetical protein